MVYYRGHIDGNPMWLKWESYVAEMGILEPNVSKRPLLVVVPTRVGDLSSWCYQIRIGDFSSWCYPKHTHPGIVILQK